MKSSVPPRRRTSLVALPRDDAWIADVADATAAACHAPVSGRRPRSVELDAVRDLGRRAAEQGVGAGQAVEMYLSAAWRLWRELPVVVRSRDSEKVRAAAEAVLRVVDDAVAVLVEGHQAARRQMIRQEESLRREFIDDLLRGDADVSRMVSRAEPFGLDLGRPHQVVLAVSTTGAVILDRAAVVLERIVVDHFGDRDVLVAIKDERLVALVPGATGESASSSQGKEVSRLIQRELNRLVKRHRWQVAAGRSYPGAYGIPRSYEEAREALTLSDRLNLETDALQIQDLLVYRVLGRDQAAIVDLIRSVLTPLTHARGGAGPLLETMYAYFAAGEVATDAAQRLHLSVRTVTYRLEKVKTLTGHDPREPSQRFTLHAAVLGARLLDWPAQDLPSA
jgi:sugar diacid utilization regulator